MKTILVSFSSSDKWRRSQENLDKSARKFGISGHAAYTETNLNSSFVKRHESILNNQTRGYGYWMWKPFIINETMKLLNEGDILIYADSGSEIISDPTYLIDKCQSNDIVLFENYPHLNKTWTKRDCFVMMGCDSEKYWNGSQVDAAFQLYKKTPDTVKFIEQFLGYAEYENIINDDPNLTLPNLQEFRDHRHDQSILSNLALRQNIKLLKQPAQFGDPDNRGYAQIFNHNRGIL